MKLFLELFDFFVESWVKSFGMTHIFLNSLWRTIAIRDLLTSHSRSRRLGRFDLGQFLEGVWVLVFNIGDEVAFFNEIILFILLSRI